MKIEIDTREVYAISAAVVLFALVIAGFWFGAVSSVSQDIEDTNKNRVDAAAGLHMGAMDD